MRKLEQLGLASAWIILALSCFGFLLLVNGVI